MINIKAELNLSDDLDSVVKNLDLQQEELNKKMHIFKFMRFADSIAKLKDMEDFKQLGIESGAVGYGYDNSEDEHFAVLFFFDQKGIRLNPHNDKNLRSACKFPGNFNLGYINHELRVDKLYYFNFNDNIKKKLIDLFLSEELKAILEYNEIDNELSNKNRVDSKKHKL